MKILHVDTEKGLRGGEQQLLYLVEGLKRRGVRQAVACRVGDRLFNRCRELGVEVIPLKGNQTSDLFRLGAVAKGFSLVHAHAAKAHTLAALSKKFHGKPVVYTRRVDYPPKLNRLTLLKYKLTDSVVAISKAVKGVLESSLPFLKGKVKVIYSAVDTSLAGAVDPDRVEQIRRELGGEPIIGSFAALTHQKDIPNLIEAAGRVVKEYPFARFVVFGEGKLRKRLQALIEERELTGNFTLYGFVEDVPNYMKALDLFVLPSRNEGLGSVILTAMLLKVPVVATAVGGTVEVIENGKDGVLVPPESPKELAEAVLKLLSSPNLQRELTQNAYSKVVGRFCKEVMVDSYLELYGEVLGG
ncbi:glycosyltransferase family 4 protein [Thermovibrio ammonificans]